MRDIPDELADRIESGAATMCHAWVVRRVDGTVMGFTDHDRDLVVDGVVCRAASGWTVGAGESAVGLVAGLLWGARQGVQFSLSLVVLKALPVLIIGGFTSIGGAIVGGLIVGAAENLAEVYIGPLIGGGITPWFAYVLALSFLYIRPAGLFGERAIERV